MYLHNAGTLRGGWRILKNNLHERKCEMTYGHDRRETYRAN